MSQQQPRVQYEDDEEDLEEWEDFETEDEDGASAEAKNKDDYRLASTRRSSVDLSNMANNFHDSAAWEQHLDEDEDPDPKRHRNSIIYGSIEEVATEEEEVATVNGDEEDQEMAHGS